MIRFFAQRAGQAILSLMVVSLVIFSLVRVNGDPVAVLLPPEASQEELSAMTRKLGLDRPYFEQYFVFLKNSAMGDFGTSIRFNRPVTEIVMERLPATMLLGLAAMALAFVVAIPAGVYAATHRGGAVDYLGRLFSAFGQAVPSFWLALVLVLFLGVWLRLLPTSGFRGASSIILPAVTLSLYPIAALMRLTRASMLDVMASEYVKLARVKGLPERLVVWRHAFKNAVGPVLTLSALMLVNVLNGAIVVETVFAWPGLGTLTIEAVQYRDYPIVQCTTLLSATMFLTVNLLVDLSYAYINPKIRFAQ